MALSVIDIRAILAAQEAKRGRKVFDLPASGQISAGDINEELGRPYVSEFHIGGAEERNLANVPSGQISFSDFHGKSLVWEGEVVSQTSGVERGYSLSGGFGTLTPTAITTPNGAAQITEVIAMQPPTPNYAGIGIDTGFIAGYNLLVTWNAGANTETLTESTGVVGAWETASQNTPFWSFVNAPTGAPKIFTIAFVPI